MVAQHYAAILANFQPEGTLLVDLLGYGEDAPGTGSELNTGQVSPTTLTKPAGKLKGRPRKLWFLSSGLCECVVFFVG